MEKLKESDEELLKEYEWARDHVPDDVDVYKRQDRDYRICGYRDALGHQRTYVYNHAPPWGYHV